MPKHDRNALTIDRIENFAAYATAMGAGVRPGKGDYQLLQVKVGGPDWHAISRNADGIVTSPPALRPLIKQFKEIGYGPFPPGRAPVNTTSPKAFDNAELYAADLRDDAAIRMMTALLLKCAEDPAALLPEHIAACAKLSYRMADALLVAGGHA